MNSEEGVTHIFPKKEDGSPFRFLIVDDSEFMINNLSRIIKGMEGEVIGKATDGQQAVMMYQNLHPHVDIVTMDITMPNMNGIVAVEKIREFDPKACIVMVSAMGHKDIVKQAILRGAKHFIVKPFKRENVYQVLKSIMLSQKKES